MTEIILNGYLGKMGRVIMNSVAQRDDCKIVAGVDAFRDSSDFPTSFPVFSKIKDVNMKADVIIDFSHPSALDGVLRYAVSRKLPVVIATTGLTETQADDIHAASEVIPVFYTANMSIGVNLLCELAKKAATLLYPDFNIEIIEQHHNQKLDAPSGTALMIANEISSVLDENVDYEYDRHLKREKRPQNEIGIHSVRAGTIVGEHEVIFGGKDEILKISHTAMSKEIFATGALNAAAFIKNREPGMYSMKEMIG